MSRRVPDMAPLVELAVLTLGTWRHSHSYGTVIHITLRPVGVADAVDLARLRALHPAILAASGGRRATAARRRLSRGGR